MILEWLCQFVSGILLGFVSVLLYSDFTLDDCMDLFVINSLVLKVTYTKSPVCCNVEAVQQRHCGVLLSVS